MAKGVVIGAAAALVLAAGAGAVVALDPFGWDLLGTGEPAGKVAQRDAAQNDADEDDLDVVDKDAALDEDDDDLTHEIDRSDPVDEDGPASADSSAAPSDTASASDALFNANGYILPQAATHRYTEEELAALSTDELFYARNEIYARHGRGFTNERLQGYFAGQSWYHEQYAPEDFDACSADMLNDIEKANAETILNIERSRNSPNI